MSLASFIFCVLGPWGDRLGSRIIKYSVLCIALFDFKIYCIEVARVSVMEPH